MKKSWILTPVILILVAIISASHWHAVFGIALNLFRRQLA